MAKLQNIDSNLQDIVNKIKKGHYSIPKFQRDFVWKNSEIESLGDSLIRGYPISSLLIMPHNGTLNVAYEPLKTQGAGVDPDNCNYILDGQQRMTSISKMFLNYDSNKEFYFDLLSILHEKFPEDNVCNLNFFSQKIKNRKQRVISEILCTSYPKKDIDHRHNYRYISAKAVIEDRYTSFVLEFLKNLFLENPKESEKLGEYLNYLSSTLASIPSYSVPVTIIPADSDLNLVCRVFEKVNSTEKKLTAFDLINAKSFNISNFGLSEKIEHDINNYIENNNVNSEYIRDFLEYDEQSQKYTNLGRLSRMMMIADLLDRNCKPLISNSVMLSQDGSFWFEKWDQYQDSFFDFINWMGENNLLKILLFTYLEHVGSIIMTKKTLLTKNEFMDVVKKYGLFLNVTKRSFNKSDIDVVSNLFDLADEILHKKGISAYESSRKLKTNHVALDQDDILDIKIKQRACNSILYIMYHENYDGKFIQDISGSKIKYSSSSIDIHHLIPRSHGGKSSEKLETLANLVYLNSDFNRNVIKDSDYILYMNQIKDKLGDDYYHSVMKQNLIPEFGHANSKVDFLAKRAELIAQYVNKYFSN